MTQYTQKGYTQLKLLNPNPIEVQITIRFSATHIRRDRRRLGWGKKPNKFRLMLGFVPQPNLRLHLVSQLMLVARFS